MSGGSGVLAAAGALSSSRRPNSFIFICRLLREIFSSFAVRVTLPPVTSRPRMIRSRSIACTCPRTISLSGPGATSPGAGVLSAADYSLTSAKPDFYERDMPLQCPSARFTNSALTDVPVYFSLAMNSKLILSPNKTMKWSKVTKISSTALFLDARVDSAEVKADTFQTDESLGQPSIFANRFAPRHGGRGNIAFMRPVP